MKRLSKKDRAAYAEHRQDVDSALSDALEEIEAYNTAIQNLVVPTDALEAVNEAILRFNGWMEELHTEMEAYAEERSEAWHEGEAAETYKEWMSSFSSDIDEVDAYPDEPEPLEEPCVEIPDLPLSPLEL